MVEFRERFEQIEDDVIPKKKNHLGKNPLRPQVRKLRGNVKQSALIAAPLRPMTQVKTKSSSGVCTMENVHKLQTNVKTLNVCAK